LTVSLLFASFHQAFFALSQPSIMADSKDADTAQAENYEKGASAEQGRRRSVADANRGKNLDAKYDDTTHCFNSID
jgi:hypothetical protein